MNAGITRTPVSGKSVFERSRLASDPDTPAKTLEALANDSDALVRRLVAIRTDLPSHLRRVLQRDLDLGVRATARANTDTRTGSDGFALLPVHAA